MVGIIRMLFRIYQLNHYYTYKVINKTTGVLEEELYKLLKLHIKENKLKTNIIALISKLSGTYGYYIEL